MTVRVSFLSLSEPANISKYKLFRSPTETGTFSEITEVTHTGPGIILTYDDPTGTSDDWYKLQTILDTLETSGLSPAFPVAPKATCNIYGFIIKPDGSPIEDALVKARIAGIPAELADKLISKEDITTTTDSTGFWSIKLLVGLRVNVSITELNSEKTFIIPNQPSANYEDFN